MVVVEQYLHKNIATPTQKNVLIFRHGRGGSKAATHGQSVLANYGRMALLC
jgi:hypothetical protein